MNCLKLLYINTFSKYMHRLDHASKVCKINFKASAECLGFQLECILFMVVSELINEAWPAALPNVCLIRIGYILVNLEFCHDIWQIHQVFKMPK
jgi:hypothetical protein